MPRKTDKRNRLIQAAKILIHQQGYSLTTLADIAQEADVPLGNVYYYFKTKEAICRAVMEQRAREYAEQLAQLDALENPAERLKRFVEFNAEELELIARYGCPIGGLCQELGKQGGVLADQAAKLLHDTLNWTETQFKQLGFGEASEDLALHLVSSVQGTYLLTHTFKEPKLANRQSKSIMTWLNSMLTNVGAEIPTTEEAFA